MKNILERLKSPVVWGAVILVAQERLNILEQTGFTWQNVLISAGVILLTAFAALNNPTDRDSM
jgi:hypothetical protein